MTPSQVQQTLIAQGFDALVLRVLKDAMENAKVMHWDKASETWMELPDAKTRVAAATALMPYFWPKQPAHVEQTNRDGDADVKAKAQKDAMGMLEQSLDWFIEQATRRRAEIEAGKAGGPAKEVLELDNETEKVQT